MAISRRDMIRTGALGGAALLAGIALSRVTRAATLDAVRADTVVVTSSASNRLRSQGGTRRFIPASRVATEQVFAADKLPMANTDAAAYEREERRHLW